MAKRALIVLSDPRPAGLLRERFESQGWKAVLRDSAVEAVNELFGTQMQAIVLGLDLFDRSSRPLLLNPELWTLNRQTPVVLVSAEAPEALRQFFAAGPMRLGGILEPPKDAEVWVSRALALVSGETAARLSAPGGPRLADERSAAAAARPIQARLVSPGAMSHKPSAASRAARAAAAAAAAESTEPIGSAPFVSYAPDLDPSSPTAVPVTMAAGGGAAAGAAAARAPGILTVEEKRRIESKIQLVDEGDYYRMLEIAQAATSRQIKAAYFRLVKQFHPDRYYGRLDEEWGKLVTRLFRGITRAYEVLLDAKARERYDGSYTPVATIVVETVPEAEPEAEEEEVLVQEVQVEVPPVPAAEADEKPLTAAEREEFLRREKEWLRDRDNQAAARAEALYSQASDVLENPEAESLPLAPIREAYKLVTEAATVMPEDGTYAAALSRLRELYETKRAYYHYRRGLERIEGGQLQLGYQDLKDAVLFDPKTEYLLALVHTMLTYGVDLARAEILTQGLVDEEPENPNYRILYGRALAEQGHLKDGLAHLQLAVRLGLRSEAFQWIERYERGQVQPRR
jgi:curved DNA-binding protein CbpA